MVALKVEWSGFAFIGINSAARNPHDFLIVDRGYAIARNGHVPPHQRDIETFPLARPPRRFGGRYVERSTGRWTNFKSGDSRG